MHSFGLSNQLVIKLGFVLKNVIRRSANTIFNVPKIVDGHPTTSNSHKIASFISGFRMRFKLGTVTSCSDVFIFFGTTTKQLVYITISVRVNQMLVKLQCISLSRIRHCQLGSALSKSIHPHFCWRCFYRKASCCAFTNWCHSCYVTFRKNSKSSNICSDSSR